MAPRPFTACAAQAQQLQGLLAAEPLLAGLEIDVEASGFVLVAQWGLQQERDAASGINRCAEAAGGDQRVTVGPQRFTSSSQQLAHHIAGEGHTAQLIELLQGHQLVLARQQHLQLTGDLQPFDPAFGVDPRHQQQLNLPFLRAAQVGLVQT